MNRADFLISGLPEGIVDLVAQVIAVASFYNVKMTHQDLNLACYINRKNKAKSGLS